MEINRVASQPSVPGPPAWFTSSLRIDPLFQPPEPAFVCGARVTFEPGARWHGYPMGQALIGTAGCGWAQRQGRSIAEIRPLLWFCPGE
jgi:quercetin dioxygenase-like cupin family protein